MSDPAGPAAPTPLLYLGAVGRSGTTLLERTLATSPDTVALGEMVHLWDRGVRDGEPCGCGAPFAACPFWAEVGRRAFDGWENVDLVALAAQRRAVDRNRYALWLLFPRLAPRRFREPHRRLVEVLDRLYAAVHDVASETLGSAPGAERGEASTTPARPVVLVDSSKHPSYLFLMRALPRQRVGLLHVVRDPRGVAHSWSRRVDRPESGEEMERLGTLRAVARWSSHNLLFSLVGLLPGPRRTLRYEEFTRDPRELERAANGVLGEWGTEVRPLSIEDHKVSLGLDHTVSGNPMRFARGMLTVKADESWRGAMPWLPRLVVTVLTTPVRRLARW